MPREVAQQQSLEEEYKKTGIDPSDIASLRSWLRTQPHLPEKYITDLDLILAYHCCYKSLEISKKVLDLNFTFKTHFKNIFHHRVVDERIIKTSNVALTLMLMDLKQYEEGTWPGCVIIIDLNGVTLGHVTKLEIQTMQQLLYFLQEAILLKIKGFHFLNAPSFMDRVLMLVRPFLKKELMNFLSIHPVGSKTFENIIPVEALPKEAGGQYMTIEEAKNKTIEYLSINKDFFINENNKRVTEALRPEKSKTMTDTFGGIEGSFKKLDID